MTKKEKEILMEIIRNSNSILITALTANRVPSEENINKLQKFVIDSYDLQQKFIEC